MARLICVIFGTLQKCSALNTAVSFIQGRRHGYKVGTAKLSRRRIRQKKRFCRTSLRRGTATAVLSVRTDGAAHGFIY